MSSAFPYANLRFDDLKAGDLYPIGSYTMTRAEVLAFASKYDPQPYHLDDAAAEVSPIFGRLSASGWHTAMIMNLLLDRFWKSTQVRGLAGGGIDNLRWIKPVYPDDVITGELEIVLARASQSKPDRGVMTMRVVMRNQHNEPVAEVTMTGMMQR